MSERPVTSPSSDEPSDQSRRPAVALDARLPATGTGRDAELPQAEVDTRQASLWSDAWRQLRKNKLFLVAASLLLVLCGLGCAVGAWTRWLGNERAMREGRALPSSPLLLVLTAVVVVVALIAVAALLLR